MFCRIEFIYDRIRINILDKLSFNVLKILISVWLMAAN
jgi:hypothetical protein